MTKLRQLNTTLKQMMCLCALLMLCSATPSFAGDEKSENATPSKPYFYSSANEYEAIEFDREILKDSPYFAMNLALIAFSKNVYRALHDLKQHHFQRQQIALMQNVLVELKAMNQELTDSSAAQKSTALAKIADYYANQLVKQNALFAKNGATKLPIKSKSPMMTDDDTDATGFKKRQLVLPDIKAGDDSIQVPHFKFIHANDFMACCHQVLTEDNCWNLLKALNQQTHQKKQKITAWISPPNFNHGEALIALIQEIFNRESFQDEIEELIQQEIYKALPLSTQQSQSNDGDNSIDYFTGGIVKQGDTHVKRSEKQANNL